MVFHTRLVSFTTLLLLLATTLNADEPLQREADVCVYGGTSGGVMAAVQAARMGKHVALVEPGRHLGGMTSGGLSAVDIGDPRSVGGLAREYFTRLVSRYGKQLQWDQPFRSRGGPATGGAYSIEPHVAERVFDEMAAEAGVAVLREARLKSVKKDGARIVELLTDDGRAVRAKMFIDATYEGDLLAAAGVSCTLLREGNAKYGETYNGIYYSPKYRPRTDHKRPGANGRVPGGQGVWDRDFPLDPYVVKGDATSGLLPLVDAGEPGKPGEPAPGVQAYCFRLCLTTNPANMIPIAPPPDYDAARYKLVARFIEACVAHGDDMDLRWFSKHDPLPNDKWDFNTATFGANLPGASWAWPEASYQRRAEIAKEIENYHRGLLHFLATDARVPQKVRREMQRFGLPKDEFTDNGGWPHQVYVREGRRMVGDLVMTEHHTFGRETAPHSIGLGSYGTDAHEIRRIVKDGVVTREGKIATGRGGFGPYQIGYGAIVPKQGECENLFVTFALSASHPAFASIRMEPVFMVTSQSAATAACLAIDSGAAVQQVDYDELRKRLIADHQVLAWPPTDGAATPPDVKTVQVNTAAAKADVAFHIYAPSRSTAKLLIVTATPHDDGLSLKLLRQVDLGFNAATITAHPGKPILYVAPPTGDEGKTPGAVVSLNDDGGYLRHAPVTFAHGYSHLSLDRANRFLLGANYFDGFVDVYALDAAGNPSKRVAALNEGRRNAHCVLPSPDNRFVYIPYVKETNAVFQYRFDPETGKLAALDPKNANPPEGIGPRHIAYHPTKPIVYFSNEQQLGVSAYDIEKSGQLKLRQVCDAVDKDQSKEGISSSDIAITPDGRFLFAGIRGHTRDFDWISRYRVEASGDLALLGLTPADKIPWGLALSPDGHYLLATAYQGATLRAFKIGGDGDLTKVATLAWDKEISDLVTR